VDSSGTEQRGSKGRKGSSLFWRQKSKVVDNPSTRARPLAEGISDSWRRSWGSRPKKSDREESVCSLGVSSSSPAAARHGPEPHGRSDCGRKRTCNRGASVSRTRGVSWGRSRNPPPTGPNGVGQKEVRSPRWERKLKGRLKT